MKGKKRKGADEPKQPDPKVPKPKPKDKPDTVGWHATPRPPVAAQLEAGRADYLAVGPRPGPAGLARGPGRNFVCPGQLEGLRRFRWVGVVLLGSAGSDGGLSGSARGGWVLVEELAGLIMLLYGGHCVYPALEAVARSIWSAPAADSLACSSAHKM
ncbi:hypothetical protein V8C86DRAFT_3024469 [Haematococcus lacustris]